MLDAFDPVAFVGFTALLFLAYGCAVFVLMLCFRNVVDMALVRIRRAVDRDEE